MKAAVGVSFGICRLPGRGAGGNLRAMRFAWWLGLLLVVAGKLSAVHYDQSRASVLQELGKPTSSIMRSGREVMLYPNGVRIEFEQGKVVFLQGIEPTEPTEPAAEEAPAVEPAAVAPKQAPAAKEAEKESPKESPKSAAADDEMEDEEEVKLTPEQAKALEEAEKEFAAARAKAQAELEKATEDLAKIYDGPAEKDEEEELKGPARTVAVIIGLLIQAAVQWVLMVIAIKITKYWAVDIEWPGILIAASVDTAVKVVVRIIGIVLMDLPMLFYADEALGALAMVFVLRKVSTNQRLEQAVTVTFTSKIFAVVCGYFLGMMILSAIF
jgi:flagellar motor protein MotB